VINYEPLTGACGRIGEGRRIRVELRYCKIYVYHGIWYDKRYMFSLFFYLILLALAQKKSLPV
jgi:hypothetical protein